MAALALAVSAASAADITGFTTYDYGRSEGSPYKALHEGQVGLKLGTSFGTFDLAAVGKEAVTNVRSDSYGVEAGYSAGFRLGPVSLTGRVGLGQVEQAKYYSLGAEASLPVTSKISLFGGYRHRNGLGNDTSIANRYTAGVDLALTQRVSARLGYSWATNGSGRDTNGVTSALAFSF